MHRKRKTLQVRSRLGAFRIQSGIVKGIQREISVYFWKQGNNPGT